MPTLNPSRKQYIEQRGLVQYKKRYTAGWKSGERATGLDRADADGRSGDDAWMDGYLDASTDREKWHLLFCTNHDNCP